MSDTSNEEKVQEFEELRDALHSLVSYAINQGNSSEVFGALLHNAAWFIAVTGSPDKLLSVAHEGLDRLVKAYLDDVQPTRIH